MGDIKYGIIGTGMMGIEHIMNLKHLEGTRVVAIADPDAASRRSGVTAAGDVADFSDYRQMIENVELDAVVIVTPNMTHAGILRDVLAHDRLHVLIEKPLCTTVEDCREVIDLAAGRHGIVWVGLEYRYMRPVSRLITEVASGTVGELKMLSIREHRFPFLPKVNDWNRLNRNSGGTLVEKCCHYFDLMNLIVGAPPARIYASGAQDVNHLDEVYDDEPSDVMDNAFVIIDYANGVRANLDLCMFAEATKNQEEVVAVGDRGKVEALIPEHVVRIGRRGQHFVGAVDEIAVEPTDIPYLGHHHGSSWLEHRDLRDAIRSGAKPDVSLQQGLLSVAMGVAGQLSIAEQRPVLMEEVL